MPTSPLVVATPAEPARAGRLEVELVDPPFPAELWRVWEDTNQSHGCTREFVEHFEVRADAALGLGLVREPPFGEIRAAFLFALEDGRVARVLGRFYGPSAEHLGVFVEAVFAQYPRVRSVCTGVIDALPDPGAVGRPVVSSWRGVEMRISLPRSVDEYERGLDREFRKATQRFERRIARECPSARVMTLEHEAIPSRWISEIVRLNRARMASKRVRSTLDARFEEGILAVARVHGVATVLLDGERVCAGAINVHRGTEAFGWVIAHDDAYARFRPGTMCSLGGMRAAIAHGVRTFHMLHGESQYKKDLGGWSAPLASYVILRSWSAATAADLGHVLASQARMLVRNAVDALDPVAARVLKRRDPIKAFAREVVHRASKLGRS